MDRKSTGRQLRRKQARSKSDRSVSFKPKQFSVYREEPDLYQLAAEWQCMTGEALNPLELTGKYGDWVFRKIAAPTVKRIMEIHSSVSSHTPIQVNLIGDFLEGEIAVISSFFPGTFS